MKTFEHITVGDTAELKHVVTQADIEQYVELSGDDNRIHTDPDYASTTAFKKPIAHGMLGVSFISAVLGTKLPGHGSVWVSQQLEFLLPVRVGDELTVRVEVLQKVDRTRIVELKTEIYNQNNQKVTTGTGSAKMVEQARPSADSAIARARKIALVVGGSGAVGTATCAQLARDGFDVAVHYHANRDGATRARDLVVAAGRQAKCWAADVTDLAQVKRMVDEIVDAFGSVTVLVNCSGTRLASIKFEDTEWAVIQRQIDVHLLGTFNLLKCVVPVMGQNKDGKVITITSQSAESPPLAHYLPFNTAKGGLSSFSKALAIELAPKGICVNMVSPGLVDTSFVADIPEKERLLIASRAPLRRLARPEDIAGAVSFLASDQSGYLTGETIRVNGGQCMS